MTLSQEIEKEMLIQKEAFHMYKMNTGLRFADAKANCMKASIAFRESQERVSALLNQPIKLYKKGEK